LLEGPMKAPMWAPRRATRKAPETGPYRPAVSPVNSITLFLPPPLAW